MHSNCYFHVIYRELGSDIDVAQGSRAVDTERYSPIHTWNTASVLHSYDDVLLQFPNLPCRARVQIPTHCSNPPCQLLLQHLSIYLTIYRASPQQTILPRFALPRLAVSCL